MKNNGLVWGLLLVLIGFAFLLFQLFPGLWMNFSWPWILIGIGGVFAIASLLSRTGGLMIPAFILGGLGATFIVQSNTNNWASWAYVWTLIPAMVGLGMLVGSLYDPEMRPGRLGALIVIGISLMAYAVFGGFLGMNMALAQYWPVLLIIGGAAILIRSLLPPREKSG